MNAMATSEFPIITKLGGREAALQKLKDYCPDDAPASVHTLRMWATRGQIPGNSVTALMKIAESEQIPYAASDFMLAQAAA